MLSDRSKTWPRVQFGEIQCDLRQSIGDGLCSISVLRANSFPVCCSCLDCLSCLSHSMFAERSECLNMYIDHVLSPCERWLKKQQLNTLTQPSHVLFLHGRGAWLASRSKSSLVQYRRCSPRTEAFYSKWWNFNRNKLEPQETGRQSDAVEKLLKRTESLDWNNLFETGASGGNEHEGPLSPKSLDIAGIGHLHPAKSRRMQ